jgi:CheY-like chemotaxis protein
MLLKKIVIAEDDDAIAHMVNMALGDAGFLCLRARDGDEALKLVKAHDPDLLVLDVMMPRVDGLEVARRLKADVMWSRTPILMLTALAQVDDQVQGLEAGADAYMSKPFDLRELGARVKALIRSARRERDRSPTTNLPGSRAIDEEIEGALKSGKPTACVHIDVLNFDSYADQAAFLAAWPAAVGTGGTLSNARQDAAAETARATWSPIEAPPTTKAQFFQGEPQSMRFVSTYSLQEAARGLPRILEFQVIPGEGGRGVRLVVNEQLYSGPAAAGFFCLGPGGDSFRFRPIEIGPRSFVLADRLSFYAPYQSDPDRWGKVLDGFRNS